jgi:hypothetical protein
VHDSSAAFFSTFLGEKSAENHTRELERDTIKAMKQGNLDAAEHYLERNLSFTLWTQGMKDEDSRRVSMEYAMVSKANEYERRQVEESAKLKSKGMVPVSDSDEPAVQMAALIVNRYQGQKARI